MTTARTPSRLARSPRALAAAACCALAAPGAATGQVLLESLPQAEGVGVVDRRGELVDRSLAFTDSAGVGFTVGEVLAADQPVVLMLAYYDCPLLCDMMLESVSSSLAELSIRPGDHYRVLIVSIDPENTTDQAAKKRDRFLGAWGTPLTDDQSAAITFATSRAESVTALAAQVGYHYKYLPESGEFSHPPALMFLKPDGTLHTTLIGVGTDPRQVMLAITDAADGKPASLFQQVLFSCFSYDPHTGRYTATAWGIMRVVGVTTGVVVLGTLGLLFSTGRRRDARRARAAASRDLGGSTMNLGRTSA